MSKEQKYSLSRLHSFLSVFTLIMNFSFFSSDDTLISDTSPCFFNFTKLFFTLLKFLFFSLSLLSLSDLWHESSFVDLSPPTATSEVLCTCNIEALKLFSDPGDLIVSLADMKEFVDSSGYSIVSCIALFIILASTVGVCVEVKLGVKNSFSVLPFISL